MTLITIELSANGKALIVKTNQAVADPSIDYRQVNILIANIAWMLLEENPSDGVALLMNTGQKISMNYTSVTSVGANVNITSNQILLDEVTALAGL